MPQQTNQKTNKIKKNVYFVYFVCYIKKYIYVCINKTIKYMPNKVKSPEQQIANEEGLAISCHISPSAAYVLQRVKAEYIKKGKRVKNGRILSLLLDTIDPEAFISSLPLTE